MKHIQLLAVFLVFFASADQLHAQGKIVNKTGFPKTGSMAGEIDIEGTITPDKGWSVVGEINGQIKIRVWKDGEKVQILTQDLNKDKTTWGPGVAVGTLPSGVTVNVVIDAVLTAEGKNPITIATAPAKVKVK